VNEIREISRVTLGPNPTANPVDVARVRMRAYDAGLTTRGEGGTKMFSSERRGTLAFAVRGSTSRSPRPLVAKTQRQSKRAWQLPLTEEYGEQLRTNFADMANVAGREGGAITAAAFLGKFTQGLRWAHMDIAGTAWHSGAAKGATGRPLSLVSDFLTRRALG